MDEKWFLAVVKRRHNKQIVSLGIQPIAHKTHHTSHMHKVLGITTSSFLRVDNDIKKGGTGSEGGNGSCGKNDGGKRRQLQTGLRGRW